MLFKKVNNNVNCVQQEGNWNGTKLSASGPGPGGFWVALLSGGMRAVSPFSLKHQLSIAIKGIFFQKHTEVALQTLELSNFLLQAESFTDKA